MYCDKQSLIDRFSEDELIQLTDRNDLLVIDDDVLNRAIKDACAEMDGYIGSRYTLPLADVPLTLSRIAGDITRYFLYDEAPSDQVRTRYEDAIKFLVSVSQGKISLGVTDTGSKAISSDLAEMESAGSVFNRNDSQGFI